MKKCILSIMTTVLMVVIIAQGNAYATKHVIDVGNYYFNPSSITNVTVGDTMRWEWVEGSHTTTSTTIPAGAATWNHTISSTNTFYEYKVTVSGTYNYKCTPHASMGMVGSFVATGAAPTLTVLPSNQNVNPAAGTTAFTVASNSSWTTSSNASWCTVTPSGSGNGSIQAVYTENTSVNQRVASITVTVSGLPAQNVTVTQAGAAPTLSVGPANQNVGYLAGTTSFNVSSNTSWSTQSDKSWCTATASGSGNGTITATFSENPTNAIRVANITVTVTGLGPQTVTVTQDMSHVSVNENPGKSFSIYPNPSKGEISISLGDLNNKSVEISVIDAVGQTLMTRKSDGSDTPTFDLSSLPRGSYFIRVASAEGVKSGKLQLIR